MFDELEIEPGGDGSPSGPRRWVAASVAALLVAAAVGIGYAVGRTTGDDPSDAASSADVADTVVEDTADTAVVPVVTQTADDGATDSVTPRTPQVAAADASDSVVLEGDGASGAGWSSSGGAGYTAFGVGPLDLLAERVTPDALTLRAHLGDVWDHGEENWGAGDWRPPPWCYESGQLRIAMVGDGVIDVGGVPWYSEPYQGRAVSWLTLGGVDGSPHWVVVVQAPAGTTSVTATFADGATDTAEPQNGIALLTVPGEPAQPVTEGGHTYWSQEPPVFDVRFDGGVAAGTVTSSGMGSWDDPEFVASCQPPPPALPEPGDQPADPAAAEEQIVHAMTVLYDASELGERDLYVDDPTGVGEARQEIADGAYAEQAASAQAVVEELVFTSPEEAWFRYRIETEGGLFNARYGIAVDVDGVWKITRDTVCQDMSLAGGTCVPGSASVRPPGSEIDVLEYTD